MTTAGDGFKLEPDEMRECIKLAKQMLEELEERSKEVPDLAGLRPPAEDQVTMRYTVSGGSSKSAMLAINNYSQAFNGQFGYLSQLVPNLEQALAMHEAEDEAAAATMQAKEQQL